MKGGGIVKTSADKFAQSKNMYDDCLDNKELDNSYLIINETDLNKTEDDFNIDIDNECEEYQYICDYDSDENCVNCFHSNGHYCKLRDKNISVYTPLCWGYRDCLTMRASDYFQDDYDDF